MNRHKQSDQQRSINNIYNQIGLNKLAHGPKLKSDVAKRTKYSNKEPLFRSNFAKDYVKKRKVSKKIPTQKSNKTSSRPKNAWNTGFYTHKHNVKSYESKDFLNYVESQEVSYSFSKNINYRIKVKNTRKKTVTSRMINLSPIYP